MILGSIVLVVIILTAQLLRRDPAQVGQVPYGEKGEEEHGLKLETQGLSLKEAVYTKQFWLVFGLFSCYGFSLHRQNPFDQTLAFSVIYVPTIAQIWS